MDSARPAGEARHFSEIRKDIGDEELQSLTSAIKARYGIDFTNYESKSLKRGFARLITKNGMDSLIGLWAKILKDRAFFHDCIDDLLVNLTGLFRNPEIWTKIRNDVLNQLRMHDPIRIWHAGCSTGEEVYTMGIVLQNTGLHQRSELMATDLSSTALAKAMEGAYPQLLWKKYQTAFHEYLPNARTEDYFKPEGLSVRVNETLKRNVLFQRHNLVQDPMHRKFHLVFCRNVMIYFDEALKMKVLRLFHSCLEPGGFLVIGYYDMLPEQHKELFTLYDATMRIYRKR